RGTDADEPAVYDDTSRSGGVREGLQTEDCNPVSLHGTESAGIRGRVEGHDDRGSSTELVSEELNPKSQIPSPKSQDYVPNPKSQLGFGIWDLGFGFWDFLAKTRTSHRTA